MTNQRLDDEGIPTAEGRIPWTEVEAIGLRTTADGPFVEDVFWMFLLFDGFLEVPGSLVQGEDLDVLYAKFPDIDSYKFLEAMGSTQDRLWRLWHAVESKSRWKDETFGARFTALVERLGGHPGTAGEVFERLRGLWSAEDRRYHNLEHLADCLRELDAAAADAPESDVAELALWFHDAVYEPRSRDGEERSAGLLLAESKTLRLPEETARIAADGVRATAHGASSGTSPMEALVADVDLSVLGRDPLRFMEFEYAVEEEYKSVPSLVFRRARGRFLDSLLSSPSIFRTEHFHNRYERQARSQIAGLLNSPRYRVYRWLRWLPF